MAPNYPTNIPPSYSVADYSSPTAAAVNSGMNANISTIQPSSEAAAAAASAPVATSSGSAPLAAASGVRVIQAGNL
jgi:hypothetical protein